VLRGACSVQSTWALALRHGTTRRKSYLHQRRTPRSSPTSCTSVARHKDHATFFHLLPRNSDDHVKAARKLKPYNTLDTHLLIPNPTPCSLTPELLTIHPGRSAMPCSGKRRYLLGLGETRDDKVQPLDRGILDVEFVARLLAGVHEHGDELKRRGKIFLHVANSVSSPMRQA